MTGLLDAIGGKLAERWVALLALPGTLFLGTAWAAHVLGARRPFDAARLLREVGRPARWADAHGAAGLVLVLVGLLLLAVVPGLVVQLLARGVQLLWLGPWPAGAGEPLVRRRRERRVRADARVAEHIRRHETDGDPAELAAAHAAEARRDRISPVPPARPTRMGDRVHALEHRVGEYYAVPFAVLWPRLWLAASEADRAEIRAAAASFDAAARLSAWGLLYVLLAAGTFWWPALVAGAVVMAAAWWTGRERLFVLADLADALVDLRMRSLARAAGLPVPPGPVAPATWRELDLLLRRMR
ncbi:hypothetical protein ACFYXS_11260 [Streptomyces sp. NPDC002574]|uniref:hypothetical protein n=1 Tax=Streptomyces sp. NPDC002574 TaxID=3364652 RepID=UPI00368E418D